jgi:hypothetical protein
MLRRSRVIKSLSGLALLFAGMAIVQSLPAQNRFRDNRMRLFLPAPNPPAGVVNGGPSVIGVLPAPPITARALGTPVLVGGNFGQQGQIGTSGSLGSIGNFGNTGSQGNLGFGSIGNVGAIGGGSLGSIGSIGSFGAAGIGGSIGSFGGGSLGALGGSIGAFGGGAFGKTGAVGANGAIGL